MLSGERTRPRSMHKHTSAALNAANVDIRPTIAANGHVLHDDGPPKQAASASVNLRHSKSRRLEMGGRWRGRRQGLGRCARPHHRRGGQASTVSRSMERRCARPRQQRARSSIISASASVVLSRRWRRRRQGLDTTSRSEERRPGVGRVALGRVCARWCVRSLVYGGALGGAEVSSSINQMPAITA